MVSGFWYGSEILIDNILLPVSARICRKKLFDKASLDGLRDSDMYIQILRTTNFHHLSLFQLGVTAGIYTSCRPSRPTLVTYRLRPHSTY